MTTGELVDLFCKHWGEGVAWENQAEANAPHEANFLKLDCSLIKSQFNWQPRLSVYDAINYTVEWSKAYLNKADINDLMKKQIESYIKGI